MIEYIYQHEATIRLSVFFTSFMVFAIWEWLAPKRELSQVKSRRWFNNFALVISSTVVVRILLPTAAIGMAYLVEQSQWGFVYYFDTPFWLNVIICFILLDLSIYFQHAIFHVLPVFWRFHRVHHSDLDFDISTGLRFHPIEVLMSILIKLTAIVALGAPVLAVILFEISLNLMSMFTHSNIRLNERFEKTLRWFFVTPDMHRIHHSILENETNSNFGFNISIWDRILGTYLEKPMAGQQNVTIGLEWFQDQRLQTFKRLLYMPFTMEIKGYAINYRDTKNSDELELARDIALQNKEKADASSELASYMKAIDQHALVSVTDINGAIIQTNDKFCEVSGYSRKELLGQDHRIVNSGLHPKSFFKDLWDTISNGNSWQGEVCNKNKYGNLYWVDSTIVPAYGIDGEIDHYISVRLDISDRKRREKELEIAYQKIETANLHLERLSRTDGLTNIANRRYFDESLITEISKISRQNTTITLILCDIDYFKNYNDTYGHIAGDACLQQVANCINSSFNRSGDLVARYGGEEFVVLFSNIDKDTSLKLAENMRNNIADLKLEHCSSNVSKFITVSVGVTTVTPNKKTLSTSVIGNADKALYTAKDKGRNNVQFFS